MNLLFIILAMRKKYIPVIEKLGGYVVVYNRLRKLGFEAKTPDSVRMWANQKGVPGNGMRLLMRILAEEKIEYTLDDFSIKTK